jgi:hypothetical protein
VTPPKDPWGGMVSPVPLKNDEAVAAQRERLEGDPTRWLEYQAQLIEALGYGIKADGDGKIVSVPVPPRQRKAVVRQVRAYRTYLRTRAPIAAFLRVLRPRARRVRRLGHRRTRATRAGPDDPGGDDHPEDFLRAPQAPRLPSGERGALSCPKTRPAAERKGE